VYASLLAAIAAAALAGAVPEDGAAPAPPREASDRAARDADADAAAPAAAPPTAPGIAAAVDERPPRSWFLLPVPFWLPETRAGLALAAGRDFRLDGSARASDAFVVGAYSVEKVGSLEGVADVWFRDGSLVAVRARAVHYPDTYYGLGPDSSKAGGEDFTRQFLELSLSGEVAMLEGRLRAGPRVTARVEEVETVAGGRLQASGLPGVDGFGGLGVGGSVTWDTRDQPLWPRHGAFAQAYYVRYPTALGRNEGFGKGAVDLRAFHPVGGSVLGLSTVMETTDGATPFTLLSKLGSPRSLRGYPEGRWRDRIAWAAQAELRVPVHGPIAATVFGAAGDVAPDLASLRLDRLKVAGGVGARWRVTPAGANLRLDLAVGDMGPQVYVVLLEAF
jgi:hypothetical protein